MHAGLVLVLQAILMEAGVPKSFIFYYLRQVVSDMIEPGLVICGISDYSVQECYSGLCCYCTGACAAKLAEDKKFGTDKASCSPVSSVHGGDHVFSPLAVEDGGRLAGLML